MANTAVFGIYPSYESVERAVDALPDGFRAVFMLRAVEELSTAETADCLGIPEETVKTKPTARTISR